MLICGISSAAENLLYFAGMLFKTKIITIKIPVMKMQSNTLLQKISSLELNDLTSQVKETIATEIYKTTGKVFSAAELWNIQRQRKSFARRRFSF